MLGTAGSGGRGTFRQVMLRCVAVCFGGRGAFCCVTTS